MSQPVQQSGPGCFMMLLILVAIFAVECALVSKIDSIESRITALEQGQSTEKK
jgi:hypothetical protein